MTFAQRFFGRLSVPVCLLFSFLVVALPLLAQAASTLAQNPAIVDGLHLKPASAIVKVGGTVKLDLVYCKVAGKVAEKESGNKPKGTSNDKPSGKSSNTTPELSPVPYHNLGTHVSPHVY